MDTLAHLIEDNYDYELFYSNDSLELFLPVAVRGDEYDLQSFIDDKGDYTVEVEVVQAIVSEGVNWINVQDKPSEYPAEAHSHGSDQWLINLLGSYALTSHHHANDPWLTILLSNYASTDYVDTRVSQLINAAPLALDTLNELAAALNDDPNFAATMTNALALKADSADVYTQTQIDNFLSGKADTHAHPYRADTWVPDWSDILNVPNSFTPASHNHTLSELSDLPAGAVFTDTQLTDAQVVAAINTELGNTDWQSGGGSMTGTEIVAAINAELGGTVWQTDNDTIYTHPASHPISFITGLQTALDGKAPTHSHPYAADTHTHTESEISDLQDYALAAQVLTDVPANAVFTDTQLTAAQIVAAINAELGSTDWQSGGTSTPQLNAPVLTAGTPTSTTIPLTWTDTNSSPNESSLEIQYSADGTTGWTAEATPAADATSHNATVPGSTLRYFRIRAVGDGSTVLNSDWSNVVSATTTSASEGVELIDDGSFTVPSSSHQVSGGFSISNNELVYDGTTDYSTWYQIDSVLAEGMKPSTEYKLRFNLSDAPSGVYLKIRNAGVSSLDYTDYATYNNGSIEITFTTPSDEALVKGIRIYARSSAGGGTFDNLSLKEQL